MLNKDRRSENDTRERQEKYDRSRKMEVSKLGMKEGNIDLRGGIAAVSRDW